MLETVSIKVCVYKPSTQNTNCWFSVPKVLQCLAEPAQDVLWGITPVLNIIVIIFSHNNSMNRGISNNLQVFQSILEDVDYMLNSTPL